MIGVNCNSTAFVKQPYSLAGSHSVHSHLTSESKCLSQVYLFSPAKTQSRQQRKCGHLPTSLRRLSIGNFLAPDKTACAKVDGWRS